MTEKRAPYGTDAEKDEDGHGNRWDEPVLNREKKVRRERNKAAEHVREEHKDRAAHRRLRGNGRHAEPMDRHLGQCPARIPLSTA